MFLLFEIGSQESQVDISVTDGKLVCANYKCFDGQIHVTFVCWTPLVKRLESGCSS
ncbi:unnamed protein product [Larinioides sclopetarius]|uniref:Uncharacterized protein n=1 Tax=Larinioides sclopetarius TaxID=280406 RepID=A0AAV2A415_9ARAC